jgi:hypothetical protein
VGALDNMIWNIVPSAAKMFMWKACNDLLPTKMNLLRRGVVTDLLCPICLREDETVKHILWSYPSTQDVWGCGPKIHQKGTDGGPTFIHIFEELMDGCDILARAKIGSCYGSENLVPPKWNGAWKGFYSSSTNLPRNKYHN